jgi:hypothetical protein
MGACIGKKTQGLSAEAETEILSKAWMKESNCIDKFSYEKSLNSANNSSLQLQFAHNSFRLSFSDESTSGSPSLSLSYLSKYKNVIIK